MDESNVPLLPHRGIYLEWQVQVIHVCEAYMYYGMPYRSTIPRGRGTLVARARKRKKKKLVRIDGAPRVLIIFSRPLGSIFVQYLSIIRGGYANKGKKIIRWICRARRPDFFML